MSGTPPKELECSLCKDTFRDPKTLECLHSFCCECLEIFIERNSTSTKLACPLCRTPLQLDSEKLHDLPVDSFLSNSLKNYNTLLNSTPSENNNDQIICSDGENEATHYCLDCEEFLCEGCAKSHQKLKVTKNHKLSTMQEMRNEAFSITNSTTQARCKIHNDEEIKLFCNDCVEPICSMCVLKHQSHKIWMIQEIVQNEKTHLSELITTVIIIFTIYLFIYFLSHFFFLSIYFKKKKKKKGETKRKRINGRNSKM